MKKSLIALAALATVATAAQAQSSVTLYGIMDTAVVRSTATGGQGSETELFSGGSASSRWGVRGTEDLGGGLTAGFNLESEITSNTGASAGNQVAATGTAAASVLFNRASIVSLASKQAGEVSLGRMNRLDYNLTAAYDAMGTSNIVGLVRSGYLGGAAYNLTPANRLDARYSNAVKYVSPTFNGLTFQAQYAIGGAAGSTSSGSAKAYAVTYQFGNLSAAASQHTDNEANGTDETKQRGLYAAYDFGMVKVLGASLEKKPVGGATKTKVDFVGVTVPVNAKVLVRAITGRIKDAQNTAGANADVFGLGAEYAFSKRTLAYVQYGSVNNNTLSSNYVSSALTPGAAGRDAKSTGVGIRHSF